MSEEAGAASAGLEPGGPDGAREGRYRALIEGVDAIVWEMDASTRRFTYVGRPAERMLGHPLRRWYEDGFWAEHLVHPEDRGWAVPRRVAATEAGRDHAFDYRAVAADGRVAWLREAARVVRDEGGAPALLRGVTTEITREKAAEEELRDRVRYSAMDAAVANALMDAGTLDEGLQRAAQAVVDHLDAAFARVWTLDDEAQVLELRASAGLYTHLDGPHGRVPVGAYKIGTIAAERRPHLTNDVPNDPRVGDKAWARREGMVSFAGYPLLSEGRLYGVVALFARRPLPARTLEALQQVADRVAGSVARARVEAALAGREAQLEEAQRLARLGSWEWEVAANRVTWSDELYRIYGLEPGSVPITFEGYLARVHPDDRERVRSVIGAVYREGAPFDFRERIVRPDGSVRVLHSRGGVARDREGRVARLVGSCQDVTELAEAAARELELAREQALRLRAEEEERRTAFLARAGALLSSSLDSEDTLRNLAHLAVPEIGDWCAIDLVDEAGVPERVVTAHPDPAREALARDLAERYPPDPDAATGVPQVLRTGRAELVPEIPPELLEAAAVDDEHRRILRELGLRSYMVVPLNARGRTVGAITFVSAESGRRYGERDLRFAGELASRAAMAVDNARLFREAERNRERTARVLESINDAFFAVDHAWRFTYVNRQAEALLQRPRGALVGKVLWEEFPEAVGSPFWEGYHRAVRERATVRFEAYFPPLETWFDVRAYPSDDGLSVFFQNVNERKAAEAEQRRAAAALLESERRFRFLAEAIPVQVWTAAPDGALDFVSEQTAAYFGVSAERLVGEGWQGGVHPAQLQAVGARWSRSLATGEPYEAEFQVRGADGAYRWHLARAVAERDAEGRVRRWFGSNTDIQAHKEAEQERERLIAALDVERARLQEIFQEAPAAIAVTRGPGHRISTANPAYEALVGRRDLVGKTVAEAIPEAEAQGFVALLDRVYAGREPFVGREMRLVLQRRPDADPEEAYFDFVYQPLRNSLDETEGIMVFAVEVTDQVRARHEVEARAEELRRLARQLEATNRELDQFAYVASHDLKAPLRGIANLSQWIEEDFAGDPGPEVREHLELLRGRVHRMEGLIDGILQYSRAGRVRERPEPVDVGALLREVVDLLAPPPEVEIAVVGALPTLVTERLPLQQVLMNLVGNAVKYNPGPAPRVEVRARRAGDFHEFSVADNGPGIAPQYHERIFGIFQTLAARDRVEGTGIGLSLVKKLVENRGGRIRVDSAEGAGATFTFLWPASPVGER